MSARRSYKAREVERALVKSGWRLKRQRDSHRVMSKIGQADYIFAFHDAEEIGPRMMSRIAKATGLKPEDF